MKFIWGEYMWKLNKGMVPFVMLLFVAAFFLSLIFILGTFDFVSKAMKIKGEVTVYMQADDRGTELLSLMGSTVKGKRFIEAVGNTVIEGDSKEIKEKLNRIYLGYIFKFWNIKYEKNLPEKYSFQKSMDMCGIQDYRLKEKLRWPSESYVITSGFGYRQLGNKCDCHGGIDIRGEHKVYAALSGTVVRIYSKCKPAKISCLKNPEQKECWCNNKKGNEIVIKPDSFEKDRVHLLYFHLKEVKVKPGEHVNKGEVIGISGTTGFSEAPHLHFEIRKARGQEIGVPDRDSINPCGLFERYIENCIHEVPKICMNIESNEDITQNSMDVPIPGALPQKYKDRAELILW